MFGGDSGETRPGPRLDWIDVAIHVAVTICVATLVAGVIHDAGGSEMPAVFAILAASLVVLGWRRGRARSAVPLDAAGAARLAELEQRLAHLEAGDDRLLELEERLDFAERLLAQQREPERLSPG